MQTITIIGGSGFVGRYIVQQLATSDYRVQVICRDTISAAFLKTYGNVGQVAIRYGDITKPHTLEGAFLGSDAVVNLVGILRQTSQQRFNKVQAEGAKTAAKLARKEGVSRFIHISALGVNHSRNSDYASTKLSGEKAVQQAFPKATILRPSLVIGAEDGFFQTFAHMLRYLPFLPLLLGGKTRFQPIYVEDIAHAVVHCLQMEKTQGKIYELGGPEIYSFKALLQLLCKTTKRRAWLLPIPYWLAYIKACIFELLPITPPFTRDQLRLLRHDNIIAGDALTLNELGIASTPIRAVLPKLLAHHAQY